MPDKSGAHLRSATFADLHALFKELDADHSGFLDMVEIGNAAKRLGFPFGNKQELTTAFKKLDTNGDGRISEEEFVAWWNGPHSDDGFFQKLRNELNVTPDWEG